MPAVNLWSYPIPIPTLNPPLMTHPGPTFAEIPLMPLDTQYHDELEVDDVPVLSINSTPLVAASARLPFRFPSLRQVAVPETLAKATTRARGIRQTRTMSRFSSSLRQVSFPIAAFPEVFLKTIP
jgi:hypothetical protein